MKKILTAILMVLAVTFMSLGLVACSNKPTTITEGNMTFTLLKDKTYALTSYSGEEQEVTVPATIQGYEVSTIATNAFKDNFKISSLIVQEGVKVLEPKAVNNCVLLENLDLPKSLTTITKESVSSECTSISSLKIPAMAITSLVTSRAEQVSGNRVLRHITVKSGIIPYGALSDSYGEGANFREALYGGRALKTVVIEEGVTISDQCFRGVYDLESITLPQGLTRLGDRFCSHAEKLKSIDIPDSVTHIGAIAFSECYRLTELKLPKSLKYIGDEAFKECHNLVKVIIPELTQYEACGQYAFKDCEQLFVIYNLSDTITYPNTDTANNFGMLDENVVEIYEDINAQSSYYVDENGFGIWAEPIFDEDDNVTGYTNCYLMHYVGTLASLSLENLPQNIKGNDYEIYDYAFYKYNNIYSITIPQRVTKLGANCLVQTNNVGTLGSIIFEDVQGPWYIKTTNGQSAMFTFGEGPSDASMLAKIFRNENGYVHNSQSYVNFYFEKNVA